MNAVDILRAAADTIEQRGRQRDKPNGERSMGRCVRSFNAMYGDEIAANGGLMDEYHGWKFLQFLKDARGRNEDDRLDNTAYAALAGEAAAREARK